MIDQFKNFKSGKLISKKNIFNGKKAEFKLEGNEYQINFDYDNFSKDGKMLDVGNNYKGIQIKLGNTTFNLENVFLGSHAPPKVTGSVNGIHTNGFSKSSKYYYRLIIPLEKEMKFHFHIADNVFSTDLGYRTRTGIPVLIADEELQICVIHSTNGEYFLSIESRVKQAFTDFESKAFACITSLGYVTGFFAGNQGYFFAYKKKDRKTPDYFRYMSLRGSINSIYSPTYANVYGYLRNNKTQAKKYKKILRPLSFEEFSTLSNKVYDSLEFSSVLLLILESCVASLVFMPGGFAIALETLSDLVIGKQKLKLAPIKDKAISRKIRKEMLEVLNNNGQTIDEDDILTLKKRIDQLNQTTNKSRLKAPFDLLNIEINAEDIKVLETRNDFLHGRFPDLLNLGEDRSNNFISKEFYYCAMKLYTLLNMVILKWIGYDNRVVNYPKVQESYTQIKLKEEIFRQV